MIRLLGASQNHLLADGAKKHGGFKYEVQHGLRTVETLGTEF